MLSGMAWAGPAIMSKYGTIQGVDGYSTNPFWSSNTSTYSNRMPVPVYENGPDVQTDECLKIVSNFVSAQCNALNNCADTSLSDIRPAIILQLSRMSGGNYATACSGYLDEIFRQYKQAHQTPGASATFPTPSTTAKAATINTNKSAVPLNNFFDAQKPAWAIEMQERTTELSEFQADNEKFHPELVPMDFPKTYADLSFGERMANNKAGYEPYQGKSAFKPMTIETHEEYMTRQKEIMDAEQKKQQIIDKKNLSTDDYCKKYPTDPDCTAITEANKKAAQEVQLSCAEINTIIKQIQSVPQNNDTECSTLISQLSPLDCNKTNQTNIEQTKKIISTIEEKDCLNNEGTFVFWFSPNKHDINTTITQDSMNELNIYWNDACSDHTIDDNNDDDTVLNKTIPAILGKYNNYEFFIDFPGWHKRRAFPGMLIAEDTEESIVYYSEYTDAIEQAKKIQSALKDTQCQGLYLYVVKTPLKYFGQTNSGTYNFLRTAYILNSLLFPITDIVDIEQITIVSEPYKL